MLDIRNGTSRLPARCASPSLLSIRSISCYSLVGWSDDRVEPLGPPDPVDASPLSYPPKGFNGSPFLLDPESIPRVVSLSFRSSIVGKKLYVGNLTYNVNESDLEALFTPFGSVQSAQVIVDRDTNRSKGFGFVEMGSDAEAQAAIQGLNGHDYDGRNLTVNEAKPREERGGGGGGGGRGGYGGGGGGYGGGGGRRY
jgi:cold-inducible RNA-binding protein